MSDIVAQLEVLSRESGCLIDLSAILDLTVCPKIDIRTDKGHMVEQKDDYICVTPTNPEHDGGNDDDCQDECSEGGHNGGNQGGNKKGSQGLLDLDVGGKKDDKQALIDVDALTHSKRHYTHPHGGNRLLDVDVGGKKDKDQAAIDVDVATHDKRCDNHDDDHCSHGGDDGHGHDNDNGNGNGNGNDGLLDVDVGGEKDDKNAVIDIDALTNNGRKGGESQGLLDIDVGGKKDDKEALIDVDALTQSKRCHSCDEDNDGGNGGSDGGNKSGNQGLIDLDVGGDKDDDEALIDADILTNDGEGGNNGNNGDNDDEGNDGLLGGLLDVNVGGEKGDGDSLINADVLTNDGNGGLLGGLLDLNVGGEKGDGNSLINADVLTNKVKRCDSGHCYEVRKDEVCRKNHVALDLELLVVLELLTEKELEDYLKKCGEMEEDDSLNTDEDNVMVDPLLSLGVGEDDSLLNLDVGGEDGLLNLDLLGEDGLLNLNLRRRGNSGNERLLDVDVGGKKDADQADIDVDVLTHEKRQLLGKDGLLDLQVGGYADDDESTIDVDLLTKPRPSNGNGNGNGNNNGGQKPGHSHGHHLSHYQPMCGKAIKPKPGRDHTDSCHARDVNHCLAICHSRSALLTLEANVADIILICAAIQFDDHKSDSEDNCHFFSAPEHQPCEEDEMEDKDDCYTFVRN
ncbi:uncharacterized protein J7T54_006678 [Emericellopsis cladophorae]|uniref:Uncharacterized protein n=1 Tax=Emericellopsis cladophorae TaxID=2686198 RepID=A0A9P9Y6S3_9HYPO|nr:uncharacterized protein J7T54_006678 [Emericellopsis cladophorae]KAI6784633.1 hypothetical protein J7T54_006678 [Emericellopsis cladophorae]